MRIICVDDEELVLNFVVYLCEQLPEADEVIGFTKPTEALEWLKSNQIDLAILDIDMPQIDGINLAVQIKQQTPKTAIIFLTGYSQYAVEAFSIHAHGYLLKPINKEKLYSEVRYALSAKTTEKYPHIFARTFGKFDLLVDGIPVHFSRSKAKELLAVLVDAKGFNISRAAAFAILYEDTPYDRKMQKQFDVIIRSLKDTLKQNSVEEIFELKAGELRVNPNVFDCDLYRLMNGDATAINSFNGEYMSAYTWASFTEAQIEKRIEKI